jgi:hypothetical protein
MRLLPISFYDGTELYFLFEERKRKKEVFLGV